ncbi:hypothetical protein SAY87_012993 [Trapa incisa]|uniref:Uncharacterized protein n=1 Tax=Trapa incisa TaxID=236973 RepID=A0AAN7KIS5_9MYRT|nr:hypothetical protein SAY87_012993 [Trapa incisa]
MAAIEDTQKAGPSSEPTQGQETPPTITGLQQQQPIWDWEEMISLMEAANSLETRKLG